MSIWLNEDELAKTDAAERALPASPIPTQIVSNGEYVPAPKTRQQTRLEHEIEALADAGARRLGMDRRAFLRSSLGMAAAFLAMNRIYGEIFDVGVAEAAEPDAAAARAARLRDQAVIDVQLHFVRDDFQWNGILELGEYAKRWNPVLEREGVTMQRYKFENFLKEVFLDSDTRVGLVSAAPSDDASHSIVSNAQLAQARAIVNEIAGSRRMLAHSVIRPGWPGWLDEIDHALEVARPDSWKGYTVGDPLSPSKYPWRLDDEKLVYPAYEKMVKSGVRTICIHKGLLPANYESSFEHWRHAKVDDVGKAAKDWPQFEFVIYHAGLKPFLTSPDESLAQFEKTGRMDWVTDLAEIPAKYGVANVHGELGTSFASSAVTHPRHAAALLGTLIKGMGADHVLWGTDSVWYGSPQWQIEAFRRIEIPADMQRNHGFAPLGADDGPVKRTILAENAARLYGLDLQALAESAKIDRLAQIKQDYAASGIERSNRAYGFVRTVI